MNDELKSQLANSLNVAPDEIMEFGQAPDGSYNVILFSFQKFTGVQPKDDNPISEELRPVYQKPARGTKAQLITVVENLGLDPGPKPTVKSLVKLIRQSKAADSPESANGFAESASSIHA